METRDVLEGKKTLHRAARRMRVVGNPGAGERLTFLATTEDTCGELIKFTNEIPAGAPGVPIHFHSPSRVSLWVAE
jgi:hypothetical protein